MSTTVTLVAARPEARRIAEFLERDFGDDGVAVSFFDSGDDWTVEAWFPDDDPDRVAATVRDRLGADAFGAPLAVRRLAGVDWVGESLRGLKPVAAGRFIVYGSHSRRHVPKGRIGIRIDAGQAFGTGHHGTTAGCLAAIDRVLKGRRIANALDLGTGSGVLAIALAMLTRRPVLASDVDPLAVRIASENAARNRVAPLVHAVRAEGTRHPLIRKRAPFDLVVANILAEPLARMAHDLARILAPGGTLILSGLLANQRERVVAAYRGQGLKLEEARVRDGWAVLVLSRP